MRSISCWVSNCSGSAGFAFALRLRMRWKLVAAERVAIGTACANRRFWGNALGIFKGGSAEEDAASECALEGEVSRIGVNELCDVRLSAVHVIVTPDRGDHGSSERAVKANVFGGLRCSDS